MLKWANSVHSIGFKLNKSGFFSFLKRERIMNVLWPFIKIRNIHETLRNVGRGLKQFQNHTHGTFIVRSTFTLSGKTFWKNFTFLKEFQYIIKNIRLWFDCVFLNVVNAISKESFLRFMKKASERQSGLPSLHGIFRVLKFMVHLNLLNQNNFFFYNTSIPKFFCMPNLNNNNL